MMIVSELELLFRLVISMICGLAIGSERKNRLKEAGIRTHIIICLGSCLIMIVSKYGFMDLAVIEAIKIDPARLAAQVVSGIGFLGAGMILVKKQTISGLTTAAGLWASACLGLAIGIGFVDGALIATLLIFVTLKVLAKVDNAIHHNMKMAELFIEFENNKSISEFFDEMRKNDVKVHGFEIGKSKIKGEGPNIVVRLEMPRKGMHPQILEKIRLLEGVHFVEEIS